MANIQPLKDNVLFRDFSDTELTALAQCAEEKKLGAGTPLFLENMKGESMYIVSSGSIQLSKMLGEGETQSLGTLGAGDYFGEMALIEDGARPVSAIVVQDAQILQIKRSAFEQLMEQDPKVAIKVFIGLYRSLSDRIKASSPRIQQLIMGQG